MRAVLGNRSRSASAGKIIDDRIFVGLLVMTFVTILIAGPA
jgi:hypothetical protein